jgi:hypothetical protein
MGDGNVVMVWTVGDVVGAIVCGLMALAFVGFGVFILVEEMRAAWRRRRGKR